jgi:hypothetical protein
MCQGKDIKKNRKKFRVAITARHIGFANSQTRERCGRCTAKHSVTATSATPATCDKSLKLQHDGNSMAFAHKITGFNQVN